MIKNTTLALGCALVLTIFLFSSVYAAVSNTSYSANMVLKQEPSPIKALRIYREGVLYSNNRKLYFNNERIDLINSLTSNGEAGLNIDDIHTEAKDFYLSTDIGVFHNYRRIFSKEACYKTIKTASRIFIACNSGIYSTELNKKSYQTNYDWTLDPRSPREVNHFTLNPAKTHVEYASSQTGFYYYDSRKKQWLNRSSGLKRDLSGVFGFGRFLVIKDGKDTKIFLPLNSGLYLSINRGLSWTREVGGLQTNSDGFYSLRDLVLHNNKLFLVSSQGLYSAELGSKLSWKSISVSNLEAGQEMKPDYYSIDLNSGKIVVGNSQGQIIELIQGFQIITNKNVTPEIVEEEPEELPIEDLHNKVVETHSVASEMIYRVMSLEPSVRELHKVALAFSGLPVGAKFDSYKRQARLRNIIPEFEASLAKQNDELFSLQTTASDKFDSDDSSINTGFDRVNLGRNNNGMNSGMKVVWHLGNLIYDPEINDINTSARITANIRENVLTEITQIYYQRKELLFKLLQVNQEYLFAEDFFKDKLKLEQYTAELDARTGAWFSTKLDENIISKLAVNFNKEEKELLLKIYN